MSAKSFPISNESMVVTSTYVTQDGEPILYVSRESDEEGGELWQFHSDNGDYSMEKMQLVRLDTILKLDSSVESVADLPMGYRARRSVKNTLWSISKDE